MKKNFFGLFLFVILFFTACAAQQKISSQPDVSYVKMFRTSCFGRCPTYFIEVYNTGLVRFTGFMFVKDSGIYEKNIGAEKAQQLLRSFSLYRVDTLKDSYKVLVSDLPGINYAFKYGATSKEVRNAHYGPYFLREMAKEVDALVKTDGVLQLSSDWKKISDGPKGD